MTELKVEGLSLDDDVKSLDDKKKERKIQLFQKNDEKTFFLTLRACKLSKLLQTTIDTDKTVNEIILNVRNMEYIVNYLFHHNGKEPDKIPMPLTSTDMTQVCKDKWDAEFIDRVGNNEQALENLIKDANYMGIESLLNLGCAKFASLLKGKSIEEIKDILGPTAEEKKE
jgi:hypothetical protein